MAALHNVINTQTITLLQDWLCTEPMSHGISTTYTVHTTLVTHTLQLHSSNTKRQHVLPLNRSLKHCGLLLPTPEHNPLPLQVAHNQTPLHLKLSQTSSSKSPVPPQPKGSVAQNPPQITRYLHTHECQSATLGAQGQEFCNPRLLLTMGTAALPLRAPRPATGATSNIVRSCILVYET